MTLLSTAASRLPLAVASVLLLGLFSQCGIHEQVQQARAFQHVEVRVKSVQQATVAGLSLDRLQHPEDLSTLDKARLLAAYASGNLPLRMQVNLQFRNPNDETAALNELDYLALVDGKQVATGRTTERIEVLAHDTATAPVLVATNLRDALGEQSEESLANLVLGLADRDHEPLRLTLRIRPTFITSSGRRIATASYREVHKEFTATQLLDAAAQRDPLR